MSDDDATKKKCHVCGGLTTVKCTVCDGLGQIADPQNPGSYVTCPNGRYGQMTCPNCGGTGNER